MTRGSAHTVLVAGGVALIAYGFVLGLALSAARMKAPHAPRHLVTGHLAALLQGAILLGLAAALPAVRLPSALETAAAALLLAGVALFDAGVAANWLGAVGDHFAERSLGWWLLTASAPPNLAAAGLFLAGVARGI